MNFPSPINESKIDKTHKGAQFALLYRFFMSFVLVISFASPTLTAKAQEVEPTPSKVILKKAEIQNFKLAFQVLKLSQKKRLWPNWDKTSQKTWYVSGGQEYFICAEKHPDGYEKADSVSHEIGCDVYFKSTKLKDYEVKSATLGTTPPLVILGSPRRKNILWLPWVSAWLHEHTHQWQMSMNGYAQKAEALGLGNKGDEGSWMLTYPFPYADKEVNQMFNRMKHRLVVLLDALRTRKAPAPVRKAMYKYLEAKLAFKNTINEKDYKYFNFTLWQEGIAKYTEYKALQIALKVSSYKKDKNGQHPIPLKMMKKMAKIADHNYRKLIDDLGDADLESDGNQAFYAVGAIEAMVLDKLLKNWHKDYLSHPFELEWAFEKWFKITHDLSERDLWKDRNDEATIAWKRFFKNENPSD